MSSGYFLIFHGSRDRRPQLLLSKLIQSLNTRLIHRSILTQRKYLQQQQSLEVQNDTSNYTGKMLPITGNEVDFLSQKDISLIDIGSLELATISLQKQLEKYAQSIQKLGCTHLKILPLFLTPGVHVCEDIPREITPVQSNLTSEITIELLPYLGSYPQTLTVLSKQLEMLPSDGRILLVHGTSYPGGNEWLENLAKKLNARIAYYSVSSSLQVQIEELISQQKQKIAIVPYFLFPGRIMDAIELQVSILQQTFPETELIWGKPFGTTPELTNLIVEVLGI